MVALLLPLPSGQTHISGVDDDNEVTAVNVRRERWLPFSAQQAGGHGRHPAEYLFFRIEDKPAAPSQRVGPR
jgi:hypothetical protein